MARMNIEDDPDESTSEDGEDQEDNARAPRKKRVSGLVRLTGKPKTPQKEAPKRKPRTRKTQDDAAVPTESVVPAPPARKVRGRPKKNTNNGVETTDASKEAVEEPISKPSKPANRRRKESILVIPDSAGEASDVWVVSSDDDAL